MQAPAFWHRKNALSGLLSPLGWLYGLVSILRRKLGTPYHAAAPVICVGNLIAGGSGKTPTVQALTRHLQQQDLNVHILCYGYGGQIKGSIKVNPALHTYKDVGDEALLHAAIAPTWAGKDRQTSARQAVKDGADILIMDDGFQYPGLYKDLNLLVFDGSYGFGNGHLIPAGPLREFKSSALNRADSFILISQDKTGLAFQLPKAKILKAFFSPRHRASLNKKPVVGFAGIGRPSKFLETLEDMGCQVIDFFAFPDHHVYREKELQLILDRATSTKAKVVTTTKDAIKLPDVYKKRCEIIEIDLAFEKEKALDHLLQPVIKLANENLDQKNTALSA